MIRIISKSKRRISHRMRLFCDQMNDRSFNEPPAQRITIGFHLPRFDRCHNTQHQIDDRRHPQEDDADQRDRQRDRQQGHRDLKI